MRTQRGDVLRSNGLASFSEVRRHRESVEFVSGAYIAVLFEPTGREGEEGELGRNVGIQFGQNYDVMCNVYMVD